MENLLSSVEFYVIAVMVAAAIVALLSRPTGAGPVVTHLLESQLGVAEEAGSPRIELTCEDDGTVTLRRYGLEGLTALAAVSAAVSIKGFDISIEERIAARRGEMWDYDVDMATFRLPTLARERYHIAYRSEPAGLMAAVTFLNRPGIRASKALV